MPIRRSALPLVLLVAVVIGCGSSETPTDRPATAPAAARYPVRSDLMVADEKATLGSPPRWPAAGFLPLRSLRWPLRTPDPDIADQLKPALNKKDIVDPVTALSEPQRDDLGRLLDQSFGTPAAPRVRVPGTAEMTAAWPPFNPGDEVTPEEKKERAQAFADAALTEKAAADLRLDDETLSRGGLLYRRWCVQCHGATGGGDGAQVVPGSSPPRDYRQGVFKFVTASPTSGVRGEKGKPRRDDLRRTIRHGLDGSMMPPFSQLADTDIDDLVSYVTHLSIRGETEYRVMSRAIKPRDSDAEFVGKELERLFAATAVTALMNWDRAEAAVVAVPPENCPTEADRLDSSARGFRTYLGVCAGCHADYGRQPSLRYDMWGTVVQPRNLLLGVYRGGRKGEDLYTRVYAGIYPSGMNEHKELLKTNPPPPGKPDLIWDVVHFLQVLPDPARRRALLEHDPSVKIEP
jgi:mono/diheme cytochrome c family protein